jgi:hypothetical protein
MKSLRRDSAVDMLPAHGKRLLRTMDEIIERALRKAGIFPPSVMDRHYADRTEMSRAEIIVKSLDETGLLSLSEQDPLFANKVRRIHLVVAGLQLRLPHGEITTCGAFKGLGVGCCNICHTHPLSRMRLVELPGCNWAWLCCAVDAASSPEHHPVLHERRRDLSRGKMRTCKYHNGGRRGD